MSTLGLSLTKTVICINQSGTEPLVVVAAVTEFKSMPKLLVLSFFSNQTKPNYHRTLLLVVLFTYLSFTFFVQYGCIAFVASNRSIYTKAVFVCSSGEKDDERGVAE